jgi:hypothetical protein
MKLFNIMRFVALAGMFLVGGAVSASIETACGTTTWNLTAGQTIDVGSVTVSNDVTNLYVTYTLDYPGATFGTLHLWAGTDLLNLPKTSNGTPIPGQFPYSHDASAVTTYTFVVPLASLAIQDITQACPLNLYVVTHAEVDTNGSEDGGGETAFGGDQPGSGPRWWFYGIYSLCCDSEVPPQVGTCQTAFAKGGYVFTTDNKSNPEHLPSLNLIKNRWGWAINLTSPGTTTYNIWKGAGLNKTSNGTLVGTLTVNWTGSEVTVTYNVPDDVIKELHIYASDFKPTTTAPGQYGDTQYFDPKVHTYTETFSVTDTNSDGIWLIAHAVTCKVLTPS